MIQFANRQSASASSASCLSAVRRGVHKPDHKLSQERAHTQGVVPWELDAGHMYARLVRLVKRVGSRGWSPEMSTFYMTKSRLQMPQRCRQAIILCRAPWTVITPLYAQAPGPYIRRPEWWLSRRPGCDQVVPSCVILAPLLRHGGRISSPGASSDPLPGTARTEYLCGPSRCETSRARCHSSRRSVMSEALVFGSHKESHATRTPPRP